MTIGYIHLDMLEDYLKEVVSMLSKEIEIGYECSFLYSWGASLGSKILSGQDHTIDALPTRAESQFEDRPSFIGALSTAYQRALESLRKRDLVLAQRQMEKHNAHLTLSGEWRNKPPYVFMIEREILTDLADEFTRENERRRRATRDRFHLKRQTDERTHGISDKDGHWPWELER